MLHGTPEKDKMAPSSPEDAKAMDEARDCTRRCQRLHTDLADEEIIAINHQKEVPTRKVRASHRWQHQKIVDDADQEGEQKMWTGWSAMHSAATKEDVRELPVAIN